MVGYKFMGKAHSHAYKDVGMFFDLDVNVYMHTICGRNEQAVKQAAEQFGWEQVKTNWKEMVEQPELDLIDINAPSDMHKEIAIGAIEAGKHVLCEKPLAMTLKDAKEMLAAAEKAGVKHGICFNYRFLPAVQLAKQLIDEGRLGEIYHYRAQYLQDWLVDPNAPLTWRLRKEIAGSGAHGDLNSHCIDLARFLIGEFDEVIGQSQTFVKERPLIDQPDQKGAVTVDDSTSFLARFKNGAIGTFEATRYGTGWKNGNCFEINGSKGSIRFNLERLNELQVYFTDDDEHVQGFRTINVTEPVHPYAGHWWPAGHIIGYEHGFVHLIYELINSIVHDRPFAPSFYDGVKCQQVLEAVDRSIAERTWVKVDEVE
ncbi:Gfo/Idh/MocA family protein [Thermoflavimicrobium dichotomicum]|nr:Gfo/Idh/MocA family oxidoreductase [Thermoflavimicrobium dichotomicum]